MHSRALPALARCRRCYQCGSRSRKLHARCAFISRQRSSKTIACRTARSAGARIPLGRSCRSMLMDNRRCDQDPIVIGYGNDNAFLYHRAVAFRRVKWHFASAAAGFIPGKGHIPAHGSMDPHDGFQRGWPRADRIVHERNEEAASGIIRRPLVLGRECNDRYTNRALARDVLSSGFEFAAE